MNELLSRLKGFYLKTTLPALGIFCIGCIVVQIRGLEADYNFSYIPMIILLILTFVVVLATSFYMRRSIMKCKDKEEAERVKIYEPAYRIRIAYLSCVLIMTAPVYIATSDTNAAYVGLIVAMVIALCYPTKTFIKNAFEDE